MERRPANIQTEHLDQEFATDALRTLPEFISDARELAEAIRGSP